jgi:hypothetical protein
VFFNGTSYTILSVNHVTQAITATASVGTVTAKNIASATNVNKGTERITSTAHGFNDAAILQYTQGAVAIGGLTTGQYVYVVNKTANDFQVSLTQGGSAIDLTGTGTGTQVFTPVLETAILQQHLPQQRRPGRNNARVNRHVRDHHDGRR